MCSQVPDQSTAVLLGRESSESGRTQADVEGEAEAARWEMPALLLLALRPSPGPHVEESESSELFTRKMRSRSVQRTGRQRGVIHIPTPRGSDYLQFRRILGP